MHDTTLNNQITSAVRNYNDSAGIWQMLIQSTRKIEAHTNMSVYDKVIQPQGLELKTL